MAVGGTPQRAVLVICDGGFEGMILKDPGGVKSAFNFNPQRGGGDVGASCPS